MPRPLSIIRDRTRASDVGIVDNHQPRPDVDRPRFPVGGPAIWRAPAPRSRARHADELKLDVQRLSIERLHHIFVSAGFKRCSDMRHVIFSGAENDLGLVAMAALTKHAQKLHSAHHWHVPV